MQNFDPKTVKCGVWGLKTSSGQFRLLETRKNVGPKP